MKLSSPSIVPLVLFLVFLILGALTAHGRRVTPPTDPFSRTGAPGHLTCAECHTGSGSGSVSLSFSGGADYEPGQLYTLMITIADPGQLRFGFAMAARDTDNDTVDVGTWSSETPDTQVFGDNDEQVGHLNAPFDLTGTGSYTFEVQWTAPTESVGEVTFYVAANAANGDNKRDTVPDGFDNTYLNTLTIGDGSVSDPVPPELSDFQRLNASMFQFLLTGAPEQSYVVEYSDDPEDPESWQLLQEVTLATESTTISDDGVAGIPTRFYRARPSES